MKTLKLVGVLFFLPFVLAAQQNRIVIYQQNLGFVSRSVAPKIVDRNTIRIDSVSTDILTETVTLYFDGKKLPVQSFTFIPGRNDFNQLWKKIEGKKIEIRRPDKNISGTLEMYQNNVALVRSDDGLQMVQLSDKDVIILPSELKPERIPPHFDVVLTQGIRKTQTLQMEYLSSGLNWKARYNVYYDEETGAGSLECWATIENNTPLIFRDMEIVLFSGDINTSVSVPGYRRKSFMKAAAMMAEADVEQQSLSEFYVFKLPLKHSIPAQATKQLLLFREQTVPFKTKYIYRAGGNNKNIDYLLVWDENDRKNKSILPSGEIYTFIRRENNKFFTGKNTIGNIPSGEKLELNLGYAFDLKGEFKEVSSRKLSKNADEIAYQIILSNHKKKESREIHARYLLPGGREIKIVKSSHPYKWIKRNQIEFVVRVPAGEKVKIDYTIQREW